MNIKTRKHFLDFFAYAILILGALLGGLVSALIVLAFTLSTDWGLAALLDWRQP